MDTAKALLQGRASFVTDAGRDALRATVLRSPLAHAEIRRFDRHVAERMPGVRLILKGGDLAHLDLLQSPVLLPGFEASIRAAGRSALAIGRVRHVGDPVALIVADTEDQALDAAAAIDVDYMPLAPLVGVEQALAEEAFELHECVPGNVAFRASMGGAAAVVDGFARAERRVALRIRHNRVAAMPIEPRAARCVYDPKRDCYLFDLPTQGPAMMAAALAAALKVDPSRVVVRTPHVGGSFGTKAYPYPEYLALAQAARLLGQPVFWCATRNESFQSDTQGRHALTEAEAALDDSGCIIALRIAHHVDLGAYVSFMAPHTATHGLISAATGLYDIPLVHVTTAGVLTTSPWTDAYRGAGKPEAVLVIEQLMDAIANETGQHPVTLRRRHLVGPERLPFRTASGETFDSGDFPARLDEACTRADVAGYRARCDAAGARGRVRGIGVCCWLDVTSNGPIETATLRLGPDGLSLTTGSQDTGQNHHAGFAAVIRRATTLDTDLELTAVTSNALPGGGGT